LRPSGITLSTKAANGPAEIEIKKEIIADDVILLRSHDYMIFLDLCDHTEGTTRSVN
jgi:hypothetical protein